METVQIQCGNCSQVMGIQVEHLGQQVHCPHCQAIVQTPTPEAVGLAKAPANAVQEVESIFTAPEPSDALFDAGPKQLVEMPTETANPRTGHAEVDDEAPTEKIRWQS